MKKLIFFRNDDIRQVLDNSLIGITDLFIKNNIPITHAIEPANITSEVIEWILFIKINHPDLIEIIQHGYSHKLNYESLIGGKLKKGEFGGIRTYYEQFNEISKGKRHMDSYFSDLWFPAFSFPYGARNKEAIKAVSDCGFKVINGSMGISAQYNLLYFIGHLLNKEMLFGRKISWNLKYKPNTKLFQIDTSISLIKKFYDEDVNADFFTLEELKHKTLLYLKKKKNIGFVLHHRYHNTEEKIKLVDDFLVWLKTLPDIKFCTMETIYNTFSNR